MQAAGGLPQSSRVGFLRWAAQKSISFSDYIFGVGGFPQRSRAGFLRWTPQKKKNIILTTYSAVSKRVLPIDSIKKSYKIINIQYKFLDRTSGMKIIDES